METLLLEAEPHSFLVFFVFFPSCLRGTGNRPISEPDSVKKKKKQ